jgi:glyoxylase-like metal-dependent hydrolase (beta-lactamase superfamily II)
MTAMADGLIDFGTAAPAGSLDVRWIHGAPPRRHVQDPSIQVHHYDEHTVIMRQSKLLSYEAPFLYLLFGNDRALLLDTGATEDPAQFPLRQTVDQLIADWLTANPRDNYQLVIAHTHGHGDHVAGDGQFAGRPDTTIVGRDLEAVQQYFGFTGWPEQITGLDLGGRVLEVTGSPGHHRAAITIYDRWTGFLFTGDTVLPGRLYVQDSPAFLASMDRMVEFAAERDVTRLMGCHVEMTTRPGHDFPLGATYQPGERPLPMDPSRLAAIRDASAAVGGRNGVHRFDDFIIYNQTGTAGMLRLMIRGLLHQRSALRTIMAQQLRARLRAGSSR